MQYAHEAGFRKAGQVERSRARLSILLPRGMDVRLGQAS